MIPSASRPRCPGRGARVALALLVAVGCITTAAAARAQVANPPAADRLWGGCTLNTNVTNGLASAAGFPFDFAILYSLRPNDGQRLDLPGDPAFTGPIVCTAQGASIQSTSEGVALANAAAIDVRAPIQGLAARYGPVLRKQVCHERAGETRCQVIENVPATSGCRIPPTTSAAIVRAFNGAPPIVRAEAGFAFAVVYPRDGGQLPAVCTAPDHRVSASGNGPQAVAGTIAESENVATMYYRVRGTNRIEARPCHTVADKTDCFRVFR